jgi:outer membrane biosynthesis protein TonB
MIPKRIRNTIALSTSLCVALALNLASAFKARQAVETLPVVSSASVPFYPRTPRIAHFDGVVRLRVSTDGLRVSKIDIESGQPMLAQAAEENIRTWVFEKHSTTSFEVTFRYTLVPSTCGASCNCNNLGNGTAVIRFPTEVDVSASEVVVCAPVK